MPKITNSESLEWTGNDVSDQFGYERKPLARNADTCGIGASLYRVKPGKRAFPFHNHWANDEAIWVLSGHGTLRYGDQELPLKKGDYVSFPKATGNAHQLINTSEDDLEYLCLSTEVSPEVCQYPDSDKIAAYHGEPGTPLQEYPLAEILKRTPAGYFDGEIE
jgi:uncharacterized cupin superfamily protein